MRDIVIKNIKERFDVFSELVTYLTAVQFSSKLNVPEYKSAEDHLWCVVGARESYFRALLAGEWQGFNCSLTDESDKTNYEHALQQTQANFDSVLSNVLWTESTQEILASLYEHEVMHEGQIIRLIYGLGLKMPESSQWA